MAPGEDWEALFWDDGKGDLGLDLEDVVSAEVTLEMLEVTVGWFMDDKPKAGRGPLTPFGLVVLLRGDIWMALVRTWLKMVTVCTVEIAGCWHGKIKSLAGGKLWEAPSRKAWQEGTE